MASKTRAIGFMAIVSIVGLASGRPFFVAAQSGEASRSAAPREREEGRSSSRADQLGAAATAVSSGCSSLFYPPQTVSPGMHGSAVAIGDVSGDGRNDIVIGRYFVGGFPEPDLLVYAQNAAGALLPPVAYSLDGLFTFGVAIGDVNGDGRRDVVASSGYFPGGIQVLLQNPSGGLDAAQLVWAQSTDAVRVADLNHDGRQDVVGARFGNVDVLLQQPNGTLAGSATYPLSLPFSPSDMDVGDVNNDALTDVVVSNTDSSTRNLAVLVQQTDGTLAAPSYYGLGPLATDAVAVGDVTGDGLKDVVVGRGWRGEPSTVLVYRQHPGGGLESPDSIGSAPAPWSAAVGDIDLDGRSDVVVGRAEARSVGVYLQQANGILAAERLSLVPPVPGSFSLPELAVGDVNGDGRPDVALADDSRGLVVLRNPPPNTRQVAACLPDGTAATGQTMTATAWNGPAGLRDWVALYAVGAPDSSFLSWKYLNDSVTPPTAGLAEGTVHFTTPQSPGNYEVRFFANNTYQRLATSTPFAVTGGPVQPVIQVQPSAVLFGSVAVGSFVERDLTLTNIGTGTLTGNGTTNNPAFAFIGDPSYSLAANESAVLPVRFSPSAASRFDEIVTLTGGDGVNVLLGGTGLAPNTPILHVSPMTASFGSVATGSSTQLRFTVRNSGTGTLIGSASVSGAVFSLVGDGSYSLTTGASTVVTVRFAPGSVDPFTGSLTLTGGDGATVPLSGVGTGPKLTVPATVVNPGQLIQVTASGGPGNPKDWVGLHAAVVSDTSYLDWKYLNGLKTAPVAGVTSAVLNFTMPQTPGTYNFRFFANNTFQKLATSATVTVRDTPFLEVSPTSVSFGSVTVGSSSDRQVTVKNAGLGTAAGTATVTGAGYSLVGNTTYSLTHNQTVLLTVRFTPPVEGTLNGTLTLSGSGGTTAPLTGGGALTTVSVNALTVNPGGTTQVTVAKGPGNPKDWVALARVGTPDATYLDWKYLNGSKTAPAQGLTSAVLTFTMPTISTVYEFRFFKNNTFQKLATSPGVIVPIGPILQVSPTIVSFGSVNVGSSADRQVTVMNVGNETLSGSATVAPPYSVIGTATYSLAPNQSVALSVRLTPQQTGPADGTLTLTGGTGATVPLHGTGTMGTGPTLAVNSTLVAPGAIVQVTLAGGPGSRKDWVGLYTTAGGDLNYLDWKYLNGLRTLPATGLTSAVLTFTMPQAPGTYNFRFFGNGTYQKLATSVAVTVQ